MVVSFFFRRFVIFELKIVQILEDKCSDAQLIEDVNAAHHQCEVIASHRAGDNPGLASSDVSDF